MAKSINLFLMDNDASGRIKCTLANWTGLAYKIPRLYLDKCKDRQDLKQSGVYFLFGTSEETGKDVVYVGQAGIRKNGEGILGRLIEHQKNPDKDYWTEAVVFTTSNNSFGPTEISYLENRFTTMATAAKRYQVKNGNEPNPGNITEEKECELEEYIQNARLIMGTLGHKVFEAFAPAEKASPFYEEEPKAEELELFCRGKNSSASGQLTTEGFVVFAGSKISPSVSKSCPDYVKKLRAEYQDKIGEDQSLLEDILFNSPSAASDFVLGYSSSGNLSWKSCEGMCLRELIEDFG